MGQSRPLFVYYRPFLITISIIQSEKSIDDVLGTRARGCKMVSADETTELWRPPLKDNSLPRPLKIAQSGHTEFLESFLNLPTFACCT